MYCVTSPETALPPALMCRLRLDVPPACKQSISPFYFVSREQLPCPGCSLLSHKQLLTCDAICTRTYVRRRANRASRFLPWHWLKCVEASSRRLTRRNACGTLSPEGKQEQLRVALGGGGERLASSSLGSVPATPPLLSGKCQYFESLFLLLFRLFHLVFSDVRTCGNLFICRLTKSLVYWRLYWAAASSQ